MSAQLRAQLQYDYAGSADNAADDAQAAAEAARTELMADGDRLAELDEARSELLDGATYTELFVVLADMADTGTVQRIAQGDAHLLNALQADTFAKLCRLADRMAGERADAIERELQR